MNPRYVYMVLVYIVTQLLVGALWLAGAWVPYCVGVTALLLVQLNRTLQGRPLELGNLWQIVLYLAAVMYLVVARWGLGQGGAISVAQLLTLLAALSYIGHPDRSGAMFTLLCQLLAFLVLQVVGEVAQGQAVLLLLGLPLLILEWITLAVHDSQAMGRLQALRNRIRQGVRRRQTPLPAGLDRSYGVVVVGVLICFVFTSAMIYILMPRPHDPEAEKRRAEQENGPVPELEHRYTQHVFPTAIEMRSLDDQARGMFVASVRLRHQGQIFRAKGIPLYWKLRTYDRYDGRKWHMEGKSKRLTDQDDGQTDGWVKLGDAEGGLEVEQLIDVIPFSPQMIPILLRPLEVQGKQVWINRGGGVVGDLGRLDSNNQGRTRYFHARSILGDVKVDAGEMAGVTSGRYVSLPGSYPKVLELVRQVTRGVDSDAGRVRVLSNWLQNNCSYSREFGEPPRGQDQIEHFLFDSRQGHCELFASALVMMLRSIGIPARIAAGFMGGEWQELGAYYKIRRGDAHAWTEVYYMRQGWVKVDATPAADVASQASTAAHDAALGHNPSSASQPGEDGDSPAAEALEKAGPPWHEKVLFMDRKTREEMLEDVPGGTSTWLAGAVLLLMVLCVGLPWLARQLKRVVPAVVTGNGKADAHAITWPEVEFYVRTLEILGEAGLARLACETSGDLQCRIRSRSREAASLFAKLKTIYHEVRFGGRPLRKAQLGFITGWNEQLSRCLAPPPETEEQQPRRRRSAQS